MPGWSGRLLLVAAAVCFAVVFVTWKDAAFFQMRARGELARPAPTSSALTPRPVALEDESLVGMLDIPRVQLSVAVLEGGDGPTLRLGAGHIVGTPLPWQEGNSVVAGHRDTFFRPLESVQVGDELFFETRRGQFRYRVRRVAIVAPDDVSVMQPFGKTGLTLITCYPFRYLGLAPDRFIVQAERVAR